MTVAADEPKPRARARSLARALRWWLGELRGLCARCGAAIRSAAAMRSSSRSASAIGSCGSAGRLLGQIDRAAADAAAARRSLRRLAATGGRSGAVVVEIPPERVLAKRIRLPAHGAARDRARRCISRSRATSPFRPSASISAIASSAAPPRHDRGRDRRGAARDRRRDLRRARPAPGCGIRAVVAAGGAGAPALALPVAAIGAGARPRARRALARRAAAVLAVAALAAPIVHDRMRLAAVDARDRGAAQPRGGQASPPRTQQHQPRAERAAGSAAPQGGAAAARRRARRADPGGAGRVVARLPRRDRARDRHERAVAFGGDGRARAREQPRLRQRRVPLADPARSRHRARAFRARGCHLEPKP